MEACNTAKCWADGSHWNFCIHFLPRVSCLAPFATEERICKVIIAKVIHDMVGSLLTVVSIFLYRSQLAKIRGNLSVANHEIDQIATARSNQPHVQTSPLYDLLTKPTFRRPFMTSLALRMLGLDWSGFYYLGTNLVHIKQQVPAT